MPFNINTFINNGLVYGGARPSLFNINLTVPQGLGIDNVSVQKFTLVASGSELPAMDVSPIDIAYFGRKIKVAGDRPSFPNWSVKVMNDEDFSVRSLFETWNNAINRLVSNVRDPAISEEGYKADLEIMQYGKDGTELRSYIMTGAWPSSLGAISLDWDSTNNVETFTVNFAYDYWVPNLEQSDKKAGGVNTYGSTVDTDGPLGPN